MQNNGCLASGRNYFSLICLAGKNILSGVKVFMYHRPMGPLLVRYSAQEEGIISVTLT